MHSPFPGMNPYLEQYWADIHQRLSINSSDALEKQLPGDLRAACKRARVSSSPRMGSRATSSLTSGSLSGDMRRRARFATKQRNRGCRAADHPSRSE